MYLSLTKTKGQKYLYLVESVHVPGKGSVRKIVQKYGRWDKLPEEMRKQYEDQKSRKLLEKQLEAQYRQESMAGAMEVVNKLIKQGEADSADGDNSNLEGLEIPLLYYGHLALRSLWDNELDIKTCVYNLQRNTTAVEDWSFNDLLFYLCCKKVMHPASYYAAHKCKGNYFFCPWQDISQDNFYRGLDFVYENRDTILSHAVRTCIAKRGTDIKIAFFDCTNTWFETPYDDVGWQTIRFTRETRKRLMKEGCTKEQIDEYIEGEQFRKELAEALNASEDEIIRMCGPSKDGKFNQPLVMVALAIDQTGLPIDCKVFAGNVAEVNSIETVLNSLKEKYGVKDVYFVADRGLNSTKTLDDIEGRGLGFIVGQKVSYQKNKYREEMLDPEGYRNCGVVNEEVVPSEGELDLKRFRFKVSELEKTTMVEDGTGETTLTGRPKRKKLTVNCKVIYTWDPEREAKDLHDLENQIAKAQNAIDKGMLLGNANSSGWRALLETAKSRAEGSDKEQYRAIGLKESVIEERRAIAGYAAYVYQHPENTQRELSDTEILGMYYRLVGIESCFRVMKSRFSLRPVYVRLKEHIVAHCCLCFLSLLMLRVLQLRMIEADMELSAERITEALSNAVLIALPRKDKKSKKVTYTMLNAGLNQRLFTEERTGKKRNQQSINHVDDLKDISNKIKDEIKSGKQLSDMAVILKAVGLRPLLPMSNMTDVKKRLGLANRTEDELLCEVTKQLIDTAAGI